MTQILNEREQATLAQFKELAGNGDWRHPLNNLIKFIENGESRDIIVDTCSACFQNAMSMPEGQNRADVMTALLDSPWSFKLEGLLEKAMGRGADDAIPLLVKRGAVLDNPAAAANTLAIAIARGYWPHPELLCPNFMDTPELEVVMRSLFADSVKPGAESPLTVATIDRLASLPISEDTRPHRFRVSHALASTMTGPTAWKHFQAKPERLAVCARLLELGWLDHRDVRDSYTGNNEAGHVDALFAQIEAFAMEQATAPAIAGPGRALRL